jgi:hypothetical protein
MRNVLTGLACAALMGSVAFAGEDANGTKVVDKSIALPGGGQIHVRCETGGDGCGAAWGAAGGGSAGGFVGPIIVTAQAGDGNCPMASGCVAPIGETVTMTKGQMFTGHVTAKSDPSAAWLGLRVAPVPAAVASQLGLKDKAVMVANIVKDSPAQKARLERYDIIVAVGKDAVGDVAKFVEGLQGRKPGEKLELTVIRQGKKTEVTATTARMDLSKMEMVYKDEGDEAWEEETKLHRGMVRIGPGGGWTIVTPGGGSVALPPDIYKVLPKDLWSGMQTKVGSSNGKVTFNVTKELGDIRVNISSADDGAIQVTRTKIGKDGKEVEKSVKTYRNQNELKAGDGQAYSLYNETVHSGGIRYPVGSGRVELEIRGTDKESAKGEERQKLIESLIEKAKADAAHAAAEAKKAAGAAAAKARQETEEVRGKVAHAIAPEPTAEFNVDADGRIAVSVRDGDTAAKLTYKSEEEMMVKAPKLFQRYRALLGKMMK